MQGGLGKTITEAQRKGFRSTEEDMLPSKEREIPYRAATWAGSRRQSGIVTPERAAHVTNMH